MFNFLKRKPKPYKDEPCFYSDWRTDISEGILRTFSGGQLAVFANYYWKEVNEDGTFVNQNVEKKWWRP